MLTKIPDPLTYPYERCEVWEPAPYCKLVHDDPIYHRGLRFCLMFRIPQLLPLVPIRLEKRTSEHRRLVWTPIYVEAQERGPIPSRRQLRYDRLQEPSKLKSHVDGVDTSNEVVPRPECVGDRVKVLTSYLDEYIVTITYEAKLRYHTVVGWADYREMRTW